MRQLNAKQKKMLDQFFETRTQSKWDQMVSQSVFKDGDHNIGIDELFKHDDELFAKLEQINDSEVLYTNVDRYLGDLTMKWVYMGNDQQK